METIRAFHKNWPAICALQHFRFQYFVATMDDPDIIAGLQRGFPWLFSADPVPIRVPVSILYEHAVEQKGCERDRAEWYATWSWREAIGSLGIPIAYDWQSRKAMPRELRRVFRSSITDSPYRTGVLFSHEGREYLIGEVFHRQILKTEETGFETVVGEVVESFMLIDTNHIEIDIDLERFR